MSEQKSKKTTKMDLSKWQLLSDKGYCGKTGISLKENFHQSASVSGSAFTEEEEIELQRLVRKIKYNQPTIDDMEKADALTRKKWKSQGIG
jgi:hypothetical protein